MQSQEQRIEELERGALQLLVDNIRLSALVGGIPQEQLDKMPDYRVLAVSLLKELDNCRKNGYAPSEAEQRARELLAGEV